MRISEKYKSIIKETSKEIFGQNSKIYLFGSRVDDLKKGGDIDLYVDLSYEEEYESIFNKKIMFLTKLDMTLGEQQIDLIISKDKNSSIEKEALRTGIEL